VRGVLRTGLNWAGLTIVLACVQPVLVRAQGATPPRPELRAELLQLREDDQAARVGFALAVSRNDTDYLRRLQESDSRREARLKAIVAAEGWPSTALVGRDGVEAAWLLLQHATDAAWQAQMLPVLERAAEAGDVRRQDVALLTDRVLVRSGRAQRYGNSFSIIGGRLIADPIEDEGNVDARRAAVGLPPMAEYAKLLAESNGLPVEWPRK
jgi:hypothetical protein